MSEKNSVKKSTITQQKYDAKNAIHIGIKLNIVTDAPILAKLHQVPSMAGYIRSVLMEDVRKNNPELMKISRFEKERDGISFGRVPPNPSETLIIENSTSPCKPLKDNITQSESSVKT